MKPNSLLTKRNKLEKTALLLESLIGAALGGTGGTVYHFLTRDKENDTWKDWLRRALIGAMIGVGSSLLWSLTKAILTKGRKTPEPALEPKRPDGQQPTPDSESARMAREALQRTLFGP